ncbi:hypothetical protein [Nocardia cyriacigeorgica]|uniref:hypothetical protein n=1 Tax=Nocardia cyriacigeorgica TaxID=135487 RepID=UPI0011B0A0E8|nr:hypothetical protein [Nocardia cyriacigeorgica]MBF6325721.1 hypothetical protein [Nocardia cyriacigeorgica]MBF6498494.1 hypothetical protein [Nocardia cyriacigeorgica]
MLTEPRLITGTANERWQRYLVWNTAVADVVYPETDEAVPAYMDLEDETIRLIAAAAGTNEPDPRKALAAVVQAVTIDQHGFSLTKLTSRTQKWPVRSVEPPPCLAFLALTVVAAEDMGNTDEGLAATAYYARLARLLGLDDADSALRRHYQRDAELLWKRVNRWLENLEGERGLPTAFALTHRYVGLPMSQALVREADRQRFPAMFNQFGLGPGMRLSPDDVATYLDIWLTAESSTATANLRRLWRRSDSHARIATVAALELANWDGAQPGSAATPSAAAALLIANLRNGFLGSSLDLFIGVRPVSGEMDGHMEILETAGGWSAIDFTPGTAGLWRTGYTEEIAFGSMLEGIVRLRHAGCPGGPEYKRSPRQVVPLIYDELQSAYVQAERMQLGVDSMILVRSLGENKAASSAVEEVARVLDAYARPGFSVADKLDGLPDGWTLFSGVQMFAAPSTGSTRFNELIPLARTQLTIAGGLQIPSRIRKWSTVRPPEIRAAVQGELQLCVTLTEAETNTELRVWESNTGALVASLSELGLPDGDYQVSLYTGLKRALNQQISVRLRSGDAVDNLAWHRAPRLCYVLDTPTGALSAAEAEADSIIVDGLYCDGITGITTTQAATNTVFWSKPREGRRIDRVRIGTPDPKSCVATGAHHIQLPTAFGGNAPKFIQGECTSCGLVKRYPGWLPRYGSRARRRSAEAVEPQITVKDLPAVSEAEVDWDAALDALIHLGGGSFNSIDSIARQLEGSAIFVDTFTRTLEALGHIAIERDQRGRPIRWELSPSCLAQTASGQYRLTGRWSRASIASIEAQFGADVLKICHPPSGPTEMLLSPLGSGELKMIADLEEGTVVPDAGSALLHALPRLSDVASGLERVQMPGFESAERFELRSATWVPTGDLGSPGAYRIKRGFENLYVFRDENDVNEGVGAITGVHLAKHLAANATGRTFAFYVEKSEAILTPRGCELPGLYNRAAVALSGHLPSSKLVTIAQQKRNCLLYSAVDRASADLLTTLLTT